MYNDIDVILSSSFMWWDHISSNSPLHIQKGNKTERNFPNNIKQIDDNHWVHDLLHNFRARKFWIGSKFCARLVALICSAWDINWLRSFKISALKMQRWRRRNKNTKIKKQIPEVVKDTIRFNSFPPILMFAASCSHRTPQPNSKPRATALAERESAKLPSTGKTKSSKTWVLFWAWQPIL